MEGSPAYLRRLAMGSEGGLVRASKHGADEVSGVGSDYLQGMCSLKAKRDPVTVEESST